MTIEVMVSSVSSSYSSNVASVTPNSSNILTYVKIYFTSIEASVSSNNYSLTTVSLTTVSLTTVSLTTVSSSTCAAVAYKDISSTASSNTFFTIMKASMAYCNASNGVSYNCTSMATDNASFSSMTSNEASIMAPDGA